MPPLLLKISFVEGGVTKVFNFDKSMTVFDACRNIRSKLVTPKSKSSHKEDKSYGLFLPNENPMLGQWLENGKTLDSYRFKSAKTVLEYRTKQKLVQVRTLDGATRKVAIDDSLPAGENIRAVCARIGIQNHQEFSFTVDRDAHRSTLHRSDKPSADRKLNTLRKERHTHDFLHWVDPDKTLREQGLYEDSLEITLRKKYFFSDEDIGANDPVQLHLLYTQTSEAITNGVHPVTMSEALSLSALRCQQMFGDYSEKKFPRGSIRSTLRGFLPVEYRKDTKKMKNSFLLEYQALAGMEETSAKFHYIEKSRKLDTYGTSFFAVKEKVHRRNKLHPVLLGVKRECVLTLDIKTKEVLEKWELTTIYSYFFTPTSFCLNFGGYRTGLYIVKTTEGESIVQLLDGYIQLIQQTMKSSKPVASSEPPKKVVQTPKEKMQQALSDVVSQVSQCLTTFDSPTETKIKKSKDSVIESTQWQLSALVSALVHATVILWREIATHSRDYVQVSAAAHTLRPIVCSLTHCSRLLASLGLTDKDRVRIINSAKALVETTGRILSLAKQDKHTDGHIQATLEDIASRATDLLATIDLKKGVSYATYQSISSDVSTVTNLVSSFVAQTVKIKETVEDEDIRAEITSNVKDVSVCCQVVVTVFTALSSCSKSSVGHTLLAESAQALIEAVHRLCFLSKGVCLDGGLQTDIGASACTVASNLSSLIAKLEAMSPTPKKHPVEKAFLSVLAEAQILKSVVMKKQPKRKILAFAKSFTQKISALLETLQSQYTNKSFDENKKLVHSFKTLLDELTTMSEGVRDTSLSTDLLMSHIDKAVSTVSVTIKPFLDKIRHTQFSTTVQATIDNALILTILVQDAAETSDFKTLLLEQCNRVKTELFSVLASLGTESPIARSTAVMKALPYLSSLCSLSRALNRELYSSHQPTSEALTTHSSHLESLLHKLKPLQSKMLECSSEESVEFCRKSLKTLRESVQKPADKVDTSKYQMTCQLLVESCNVFLYFTSECTDELVNHYTCIQLISLLETIVTCLLKVSQDVKSVELVERLLDEMEKLVGQLYDHTSVDLELIATLNKTVVDIRDCLPLCPILREFQAVLTKLIATLPDSVKEINLTDAVSSIYAAIPSFLNLSENPLQESETALAKFTSGIQSLFSIGIKKQSSYLDHEHGEDLMLKLKRLQRYACRLTQRASILCYETAVCHRVLTPITISLICSITDVACCLASTENELKFAQDILLLELEAFKNVLATESDSLLSSIVTSYSECFSNIMKEGKDFEESMKELQQESSTKKAFGLVQAVMKILTSVKQASHLCCRGSSTRDYRMTVSQVMMWSDQLLTISDQLLNPSLSNTQRKFLESTVSKEIGSLRKSVEFMASTLMGNGSKEKLLQSLESMTKAASNHFKIVKESSLESFASAIDSFVSVYVIMEKMYSTTAAVKFPSELNIAITQASNNVLTSTMASVKALQTASLNQELTVLSTDVQKLITTVRDNFMDQFKYRKCLEQVENLRSSLDTPLVDFPKAESMESDTVSGSLYTNVTKIRGKCAQMEKKLISIHSLPHVDYIGHQIREIVIGLESMIKCVVETCSVVSKSESSLLLVQHSSTCLEALSDLLQLLNESASDHHENIIEIIVVKMKIQQLLHGLDDLMSLTLTICAEGFNPVSIMEIKRVADRDEIPPFVYEDTDSPSDLYIHAQLTAHCLLLNKALNSMDPENVNTEKQSELQSSIVSSYKEISQIVCILQRIDEEERDTLVHSSKSLADNLVILLQEVLNLSLHPDNAQSKKHFREAVESAQEEVSRVLLLSQLSDSGEQWYAIDSLGSDVSSLDLHWVCSTYSQDSDTDQTDSQARRLVTLDDAQTVFKVTADLLERSKEEPTSSTTSSVLSAAYTISSVYNTVKESSTFPELSKCDVQVISSLRDVSTILTNLLKVSPANNLSTNVTLALKEAKQAATFLIKAVQIDSQSAVDILSATISHVEYILSTSNKLIVPSDLTFQVTFTDVVHSVTLLTLLTARLKGVVADSIESDKSVLTECALLTRLTLTSLTTVSARLISIIDNETEKAELVERRRDCISSIQSILVQFKTNIIERPGSKLCVETVTDNLNIIDLFSQDLLETSQETLPDYVGSSSISQLSVLDLGLRSKIDLTEEDIDYVDDGSTDDQLLTETCSALLQVLHSLLSGVSLSPDKQFWIQSHIEMVSSFSEELENKKFHNTQYLFRMLLKMIADTLLLWRALDAPANSDWLVYSELQVGCPDDLGNGCWHLKWLVKGLVTFSRALALKL